MGCILSLVRRHITLSIFLIVPAAVWLLSLSSTSQVRAQETNVTIEPRTPPRGAETGSADRAAGNLRVDSNLVLIPVLVTDAADRPVTGLERQHFRILDDRTEQVISHFTAEDIPVSIGLVFDSSGSMGIKLKKSQAAVMQFLRTANPADEFSLVQLNDRAQLIQGFTDRIQDIQSRLMFIGSKGRTALLDAIVLSLNEMRHARHTRKAILIISDGGDNNSRYTTSELKARLREADVQVYSIGIMEPLPARARSPEEMEGAALMSGFAQQTGGQFFEVNDPDELPGIAVRVGAALRNQYVLGYVPSTDMRDGRYHRVQVKINRAKGGPPLRLSFRSGYFAPAN
jgi:Ca-activated chloride channel family protein